MNEPILKIHWERFRAHLDLDQSTAAKLLAPYTSAAIEDLVLLSEGCANTNYKVTFKNKTAPLVLRLYIRDKSALGREVAIHKLVPAQLPVPQYLYADDSCTSYPHPYALLEWIDGILMREAILTQNEKLIAQCAFDAGHYLAKLRCLSFPEGGFFQENLIIRPFSPDEEYLPFVLGLLEKENVKKSLGKNLHQATQMLVKEQAFLLPSEKEANLTHGDYDPANMLVKEIEGRWKISAILDWEFSFAGTYLLDIGLMLRYAHKLPRCYEESFIKALEKESGPLPVNWKKQAKLMDLLCLLDLAHHNPPQERPRLNSDVVSLIANTVEGWK